MLFPKGAPPRLGVLRPEKADLLDVAHRWLVLAGFQESEPEDGQLKNVAGW
jgi:hypothetical protein